MSRVTFLAPRLRRGVTAVHVQVDADDGSTLIELMEYHGLLTRCRCSGGFCGKCAVKIAVLRGREQQVGMGWSEQERTTLYAHGKLTRRQAELPFITYRDPVWRLACQFSVGDHDIVVAL